MKLKKKNVLVRTNYGSTHQTSRIDLKLGGDLRDSVLESISQEQTDRDRQTRTDRQRQTDGKTDRQTDGKTWTDRQMEKYGQTERQTDGWTDRWKNADRQTDRWTHC